MYSFNVEGDRFYIDTDCKSEQSLTITSGIDGVWEQNNHFAGSLDKICEDIHIYKGIPYQNNYIDFYKDRDGNELRSLI